MDQISNPVDDDEVNVRNMKMGPRKPEYLNHTTDSDEEKLARLDAERAELAKRVAVARDAERPNALGTIRMLIAKHGITRKELGELVRVREFAKRIRKPKAAQTPTGQGNGQAGSTNAAADPAGVTLGMASR